MLFCFDFGFDVKSNNNMEGTPPPFGGRALPNLINAVKMFKVKVKVKITTNALLTLTFKY